MVYYMTVTDAHCHSTSSDGMVQTAAKSWCTVIENLVQAVTVCKYDDLQVHIHCSMRSMRSMSGGFAMV